VCVFSLLQQEGDRTNHARNPQAGYCCCTTRAGAARTIIRPAERERTTYVDCRGVQLPPASPRLVSRSGWRQRTTSLKPTAPVFPSPRTCQGCVSCLNFLTFVPVVCCGHKVNDQDFGSLPKTLSASLSESTSTDCSESKCLEPGVAAVK
jgi:hypothetical protein